MIHLSYDELVNYMKDLGYASATTANIQQTVEHVKLFIKCHDEVKGVSLFNDGSIGVWIHDEIEIDDHGAVRNSYANVLRFDALLCHLNTTTL